MTKPNHLAERASEQRDAVNADRKRERAPVENGSTWVGKLLGCGGWVEGLAAGR